MIWIVGAGLALLISVAANRLSLLTTGGSIAAFFLGWLVFSLGGLSLSVPLLTFFTSSNLVSRAGKARKSRFDDRLPKTGRRDLKQVLANGVIPAAMVTGWYFSQTSIFLWLYLSALATATADTWATEIGMLARSLPRSILHLKPVQPGISGGVSLPGLLAALLGALLIACHGFIFFNDESIGRQVLVVTGAGFLGQLVDSVLGATLQVKFRCQKCGHISEKNRHCTVPTKAISGVWWIDNDAVNFLSILSGVMITALASI